MMLNNLITNPLQNGIAGPLALMLVALFGAAGVALLALELVQQTVLVSFIPIRRSAQSERVLWERYRTWALIALVFAGATLSGPLTLAGLAAFLVWQGGREYAALAKL